MQGGFGRKEESKARELIKKALEGGVSPLEVLLEAMRSFYNSGNIIQAAAIARHAAPYCHPRLSSVSYKAERNDASGLTDQQIVDELNELRALTGTGAAAGKVAKNVPPKSGSVVH